MGSLIQTDIIKNYIQTALENDLIIKRGHYRAVKMNEEEIKDLNINEIP